MSYGQKAATHHSHNGALGNSMINGSSMNGQMTDGVSNSQPLGLRGIDPESLKSRLYSYAPQQAQPYPRALR